MARARARPARPTRPAPPPDPPTRAFATARAFDAWLARHHDETAGLWLKIAKAGSTRRTVTYPEAVEIALCWGWIDGQSRRLDDDYYLQRFTPRRARSLWSRINCARATALIAAGRMRAPGLAEVTRAKRDGRWDAAYDSPSRAEVPPDLAAALAANRRAAACFATLDARNRYAILHRLQLARRPETRARRIAEFVRLLARGETLYP